MTINASISSSLNTDTFRDFYSYSFLLGWMYLRGRDGVQSPCDDHHQHHDGRGFLHLAENFITSEIQVWWETGQICVKGRVMWVSGQRIKSKSFIYEGLKTFSKSSINNQPYKRPLRFTLLSRLTSQIKNMRFCNITF